MPVRSVSALLTGLIDYAGFAPPAGLALAEAVHKYAAYRSGEYNWILGRFIVPIARLGELESAAGKHLSTTGEPWRLSGLTGPDLVADLSTVAGFNSRHAGQAGIDSVELRAESANDIRRLAGQVPGELAAYFEIAVDPDPADLIAALTEAGGRAKVRTGGLAPAAIPAPDDLAGFLVACAKAKVGFKGTAGLHYPLRGIRPFTYEPDSATAKMHGFLNVFMAAALARAGLSVDEVMAVLTEESANAFEFTDAGAAWQKHHVTTASLTETRSQFAIAFGSCSFEEPIDGLKALELL